MIGCTLSIMQVIQNAIIDVIRALFFIHMRPVVNFREHTRLFALGIFFGIILSEVSRNFGNTMAGKVIIERTVYLIFLFVALGTVRYAQASDQPALTLKLHQRKYGEHHDLVKKNHPSSPGINSCGLWISGVKHQNHPIIGEYTLTIEKKIETYNIAHIELFIWKTQNKYMFDCTAMTPTYQSPYSNFCSQSDFHSECQQAMSILQFLAANVIPQEGIQITVQDLTNVSDIEAPMIDLYNFAAKIISRLFIPAPETSLKNPYTQRTLTLHHILYTRAIANTIPIVSRLTDGTPIPLINKTDQKPTPGTGNFLTNFCSPPPLNQSTQNKLKFNFLGNWRWSHTLLSITIGTGIVGCMYLYWLYCKNIFHPYRLHFW
jgi:hypothetical protein